MTVTVSSDPHCNGRASTLATPSLAPNSLPASATIASKPSMWQALRADLDEENPPYHTARLAIPELESFDQEELNDNPVLNHRPVPLVGALLIAEGLITQEQLNACLLVQSQDHPDQPIGQILVRCGYISQAALDLALGIQVEMKSSMVDTIESQGLPQADLTALVLHPRGGELAYAALSQMGVSATPARNWAEFARAVKDTQFDMALIGGDLLDENVSLPDQSMPILLLPSIMSRSSGGFYLPQWARAMIGRFVSQVRVQRRQRDALDRLHQREFELSAVVALSRNICAARSPHDALMQLMLTIRDLFGVEAGTLYRFDRPASQLVFEVVIGPHQETLYQQRLPIDRGLAGWVVRNGEPLLIPDVGRDPRFEGMFDHQSGFQTRSVLCVPLLVRGQVCGVIQLINKLNGEFNERDLLILRILAAMGALAAAADANLFEPGLGGEAR